MKKILKAIMPPVVYLFLKKILSKPEVLVPEWKTLEYSPLRGIKMFLNPNGGIQKDIINGSYDSFIFDRLENVKDKIIYDVGAHIGYHSIYFSQICKHVYSFEPNPANVLRFNLMVKENGIKNITIFDYALSDKCGTEEFNMHTDIENGKSSCSFLESADTIWDRKAYTERNFTKIKIKTYSLDSLNIPKPDIIKIDVEGGEFLVLKGSERIIDKYKPIIYVEIHSMLNMFNVILFFSKKSYDIKIIDKSSKDRYFIEAKPTRSSRDSHEKTTI